jgi:hypothetical protein
VVSEPIGPDSMQSCPVSTLRFSRADKSDLVAIAVCAVGERKSMGTGARQPGRDRSS